MRTMKTNGVKTMKTSELTGDALVWAVATCEGYTDLHKIKGRMPHEPNLAMLPPRLEYGAMELWEIGSDSDWEFFGPIIEKEGIRLHRSHTGDWWAGAESEPHKPISGPTPLIAAMRCYVASRLGDEVDVPEGLR